MKMRQRVVNVLAALALLGVLAFGGMQVSRLTTDAAAVPAAQQGNYAVNLLPSAARTTTGTGSAACGFGRFSLLGAALVVSAASGTTPTLDVTLQHSIDGGTTWFTLTTFAQKTAAGNEFKAYAEVEAAAAQVIGDCLRPSWTIAGTTPSFTFKIDAFAQ